MKKFQKMKQNNNYISVDTAKTKIKEGSVFWQSMDYTKFFVIDPAGNKFKLNKKNASLIKNWLKNQIK